MKIYYIANARMPTEKAHGIQIAKMSEALRAAGADVTLVVPRRGSGGSLKNVYNLAADIPVVRIPVIPYAQSFLIGSASFFFFVHSVSGCAVFCRDSRRETARCAFQFSF